MTYRADTARYDTMQYRHSGRSGLQLRVVSLGLWQNFGGIRDYSSTIEILDHAFDAGIIHFDLANNYGSPAGLSEEMFGQVIARDFRPYRDEMIISTKASYNMWPGPYGEFGKGRGVSAIAGPALLLNSAPIHRVIPPHTGIHPELPAEQR